MIHFMQVLFSCLKRILPKPVFSTAFHSIYSIREKQNSKTEQKRILPKPVFSTAFHSIYIIPNKSKNSQTKQPEKRLFTNRFILLQFTAYTVYRLTQNSLLHNTNRQSTAKSAREKTLQHSGDPPGMTSGEERAMKKVCITSAAHAAAHKAACAAVDAARQVREGQKAASYDDSKPTY